MDESDSSGQRRFCSEEKQRSKRKVKPHFFAFMVGALLLVGGEQAARAQGGKPQGPPTPVPNTTTPSPSEANVAAVDPNKYLIGPEDILFVRTWREPDWTWAAAVRPDGKITVPLIGDVQAAELTPAQLTKSLTELLTKYLNNPDVNVMVQEVRSKKYYIIGEVNKPGVFPLVTPTTILEALANAGGFKEFADEKHIKILRTDKIYDFNYREVTKGKHMEQNFNLQNGDKIIVK